MGLLKLYIIFIVLGLVSICMCQDFNCTNDKVKNKDYYVDVVFVLDGSGSVGSKNFRKMTNFIGNVTSRFNLEGGFIHVGVIQHSYWLPGKNITQQTYVRTEIQLGSAKTQTQLQTLLKEISFEGISAYTAGGLQKAEFDLKTYGRPHATKFLVALTDGPSEDSDILESTCDKIFDMGAYIFAIGINKYDIKEIQVMAKNESKNMLLLSTFDLLPINIELLENMLQCQAAKEQYKNEVYTEEVTSTFSRTSNATNSPKTSTMHVQTTAPTTKAIKTETSNLQITTKLYPQDTTTEAELKETTTKEVQPISPTTKSTAITSSSTTALTRTASEVTTNDVKSNHKPVIWLISSVSLFIAFKEINA